MYEPPSPELTRLLVESGACRPGDLRACRRIVRRLCRDLPAFDSVWLDALVQLRRLTPFQAKTLGSAKPERIRVGPLVVVERLGGATVSARPAGSREARFAVKRLRGPLGQDALRRLAELPEQLRSAIHPNVAGPHVFEVSGESLSLISRRVDGPHLGELLVRRGRYPAAVVWEIGRQLLAGLHALHQAGLVHGEIRPATVRLSPEGRAVLVDTGVRTALEPEINVNAGLPPERFDALAPELIGVGKRAKPASDLYALGCLLWQLLAGRPPFPGADPLVKIAAHQTRRIEDVRRWSPDTPPALAEGIARLTRPDAASRPAAAELLQHWKPPRPAGRRILAAFLHKFQSPPVEPAGAGWSWAAIAAAVFAVSGLAVALSDQGLRTALLSIADPSRTPAASRPAATEVSAVGEAAAPPFALPAPDAAGVIELDKEGPWRASTVESLDSLSLRGRPGVRPIIVVNDRPLVLRGKSVRLENLTIESRPGADHAARRLPSGLVLVTSGRLDAENCTFEREDGQQSSSALAWRQLEDVKGTATIRSCLFWGSGTAIYLDTPAEVTLERCLKVGDGPLIDLAAVPPAAATQTIRLAHVTLRQSGPMFRWRVAPRGGQTGRVSIEPVKCVFDLQPGLALVDLVAAEAHAGPVESLGVVGSDTLVRMDAEAAWVSPADGRRTALPADASIAVEGLLAQPIRFAGELTRRPEDSKITGHDEPAPGIP